MRPEDILKARSADLRNSLPAMQRAAALARQTAIATNTAIIVMRDGKRVRISADELRQQEQFKTS